MDKESLLNKVNTISGSLFVVGAGAYGTIIGEWLTKKGFKWVGYIDRRDMETVSGRRVETYAYVNDADYYLISSYYHGTEMLKMLVENGANRNHIICIDNQEIVYDMMEDMKSSSDQRSRMRMFHNMHQGKRCFIIGNGPSLQIGDLERIKNEYSFGCNSIYGVFSLTDWRPSFYVATDPVQLRFLGINNGLLESLSRECNTLFFSSMCNVYLQSEVDNLIYCYLKDASNYELPMFSGDCSDIIFNCGSVTYISLQLATYFGFEEIYLLGVDCSFSKEKTADGIVEKKVDNHMLEIEEEEKKLAGLLREMNGEGYFAEKDKQMRAYMSAKQYADKIGIGIYNATRGGELEVFERVDFDSLFENNR